MNSKKLAIVIPAYKGKYLKRTLDSIARQTCLDFVVYIGDDKSPENLWNIIKPFASNLDIVYRRFEKNLGASDLVAQWSRCIDLISKEPWIWFFSDDDVMGPTCVETFYSFLSSGQVIPDLLRFNVVRIDEDDNFLSLEPCIETYLTSEQFFRHRMGYRINSYAVEYIFNRQAFLELGGFVKFDLAWCSDDATWLKLSADKGIQMLSGPKVYWRSSGINISTLKDSEMAQRKLDACLTYYNWTKIYFHLRNAKYPLNSLDTMFWYLEHVKMFSLQRGLRKGISALTKIPNIRNSWLLTILSMIFLIVCYGKKKILNYDFKRSV